MINIQGTTSWTREKQRRESRDRSDVNRKGVGDSVYYYNKVRDSRAIPPGGT